MREQCAEKQHLNGEAPQFPILYKISRKNIFCNTL
jgi:hypothetical protein